MSERCPSTKEQHLCAFHESKSACSGDSGGPLTVSGGRYMRYVSLLKFVFIGGFISNFWNFADLLWISEKVAYRPPLLPVDEGGHRVVVGVVNYAANFNYDKPDLGNRCKKGLVDVFTKVQAFLPWIEDITGIGEL